MSSNHPKALKKKIDAAPFGDKQINTNQAIVLYRKGQATAWKASQLAGVSLWTFYEILKKKGIQLQYSEHDLEQDL
jgi:predicted HTH domain antitoxin